MYLRHTTQVAGWFSRTFHRVLTVLVLIPDSVVTVPDHKGASPSQIRSLLKTAALMHARFWRQNIRSTPPPSPSESSDSKVSAIARQPFELQGVVGAATSDRIPQVQIFSLNSRIFQSTV